MNQGPLFRSAESLFRPRSVAIVGASDSGGQGWPKSIYSNLEFGGFPARIYLVNPGRDELWGRKVYRDFASLPEPIDLALTLIPAPAIPPMLRGASANGLKCALVYGARFGENGDPDGIARANELRALCAEQGLRITGPNCMGVLSIREKLLMYPAARVRSLPPGPIGVVFQSGGIFMFWLQQAAVRGLGFSYAVSSGNELDLDLADYINFLVEDENTKLIACLVEGVRRPEAFVAAAEKALAAGKPILLVKIGRSDAAAEAAKTHTGALAGNDRVFDALCRKTGIVRCSSLDDLIETCLAFSHGRMPRGPRVAMAGVSGGARGLFLDYAAEEGLELAAFAPDTIAKLSPLVDPGIAVTNPLDAGASVAPRQNVFSEIARTVCADPNVDLIAVQAQLPDSPNDPVKPGPFAEIAASTDKPVIGFNRVAQNVSEDGRRFQRETGMPFVQGMPETARALQALVRYSAALRRGVVRLPASEGKRENLSGSSFERLLAAHGLTHPRSAMARTAEEACSIAREIGFPVAVKIVSPQASHKTEVGGVALQLADAEAVRRACESMTQALLSRSRDAVVDGYLVQEMVQGLEMIVGVRADPQFGPFMVVGLGGVLVEALNDTAVRLLPVDEDTAEEMLASLRGKALLGAFRGRAPRDVAALAKAVAGLSKLFLDHRQWLSDLEINPLMVLAAGEGVRAVDVRAVRREEVSE